MKRSLIKGIVLIIKNVHEDVYHLSKFKYPFALLQDCLSHDAQQQYENINASKKKRTLTHQDI